jgi:ATP:corrinoid adenosyltransferase
MSEHEGINERHHARMQRKKEVVDQKIEAAKRNAGGVVVNTGNGKGKSSSGFGMAARALGHGMKVGVVQFIKGAMSTGEEKFFRRFPDEISFHACRHGGELRGHAFHYSTFETAVAPHAHTVKRLTSGAGEPIYCQGGLAASYFHAYFPSCPSAVADLFLKECES